MDQYPRSTRSPFSGLTPGLKPSSTTPLSGRVGLILLAAAVAVGLGTVVWRALLRADSARAVARAEARGIGAVLEAQLGQAASAAEMLNFLAKRGNGLADFQKVGQEVLAAHPGVACLDLEPGGVVSDVVPRAGYERAIGFNVLKDPSQRAGAADAVTKRGLTVAGPVALYHKEPGIVARVPFFQRGAGGRETLWGFLAVSAGLREAMARAQVDQLPREGYVYALYAPATASQKAALIASQGLSSFQDTVQQSVRVRNLELRLALKPRGGWIAKTKLALEAVAVLAALAAITLLVNLVQSRRSIENRLTEVTGQLTGAEVDRSKAVAEGSRLQEKVTAMMAELEQLRLARQQGEAETAKVQSVLDARAREKDEALHASRAKETEAQAALKKSQELMAQLESKLNAAAQAEKKTAAAAEDQLKQHKAAMAELEAQLESARRSEQEAAARSTAAMAQVKQSKREVEERATALEQAEIRIKELSTQLETAQAALKLQPEAGAADATPLPEVSAKDASTADVERGVEPYLDSSSPPSPSPLPSPLESGTIADGAEEGSAPSEARQPAEDGSLSPRERVRVRGKRASERKVAPNDELTVNVPELSAPAPEPTPVTEAPAIIAAEPAAPALPEDTGTTPAEPAPVAAAPEAVEVAAAVELPKPPATQKSTSKPSRRRKAARDNQMDLFGGGEAPVDGKAEAPIPASDSAAEAAKPQATEREAAAKPDDAEPAKAPAKRVPREALQQESQPAESTPEVAVVAEAPAAEVSAAADAGVPDLVEVEGLVAAEGLAKAGNDARKYLKALQQFAQTHLNDPERIREGLMNGNVAAAQRLLHALQEAAHGIGATVVSAASGALAQSCREEGADPAEVEARWEELEKSLRALLTGLKPVALEKEEKPAPARRLPPAPPVDLPQLRKAVNLISPLLTDQDPGAKDCLKDNRSTFRSAFTPEGYVEFEQLVKDRDFGPALELLRKAVRKHGLSL